MASTATGAVNRSTRSVSDDAPFSALSNVRFCNSSSSVSDTGCVADELAGYGIHVPAELAERQIRCFEHNWSLWLYQAPPPSIDVPAVLLLSTGRFPFFNAMHAPHTEDDLQAYGPSVREPYVVDAEHTDFVQRVATGRDAAAAGYVAACLNEV